MYSRNVVRHLTWLLCLLILALMPAGASAQDPPLDEVASPFDPRFGVIDSFVNTAEADMAGVGWTRVFFRWDVVQPAGPSDWKPTNVPDTFLNAEIEAGREVVAVLIGTPAWSTDSGVSTAVPPLEFWGDFVFKIAIQYKGRINHWVIWNQPDIDDPTSPNYTWEGSEEDYFRFLKEAYSKIKAVDPNMQVHLAGLTYTWDRDRGNRQYLERLLDVILADPQAASNNYYFDAAAYHVYYDPQQIFDILTDVRRILDARGLTGKAIWLNETNAPPSDDYLEPLDATSPFSITLQEQSAFVIQAFSMALAGGAERVAINKMRNQAGAVVLNGLLRSDNSRRPAFDAFRAVTTHFAGVQTASLQQLGSVNVVTLARGGQTTTVLWNTTTTTVNVALPAIAPDALLVTELMSEQPMTAANGFYTVELPGAICSNGSNCFIGGAPRLVVEAGSPAQRPILQPPSSAPTPTPLVAKPTSTPTSAASPTTAPPPTLTPPPTPEASSPPPTVEAVQDNAVIDFSASTGASSTAVPSAFSDPGVGQLDEAPSTAGEPTLTAVPPVTFSTVMSLRRILWLFVIGVIVFTITYGVQVIIWYRLKR